jgi:hypothetical protein
MTRRLPLPGAVLFLATIVAISCGGDDEAATSASLSGIMPGTAYLGRTFDVMISGNGTHFAGQPTVSFSDPAIKSTKVDVLSPTSLRATIEMGEGAISGTTDVIVTTPGQGSIPEERATLQGGLIVSAPLKYEIGGTVPQGGLLDFVLTNLDKDNPFTGPAAIFESGGVAVRYTEVAAGRIAGTLLVDPLAPVGKLRLKLRARNPRGELLGFVASPDDPMAPAVTPAPQVLALTIGQVAGDEAIRAPRQTNVYRATVPGKDHVYFLNMKTVGGALRTTTGARLIGAIAPGSGKFGEGSTFDTSFNAFSINGGRGAIGLVPSQGGEIFFAIHTSDFSGGASEYGYTLQYEAQPGTAFSMKEPAAPDSPKTPLASIEMDTAPFFATDGAIDTPGDADYVLF